MTHTLRISELYAPELLIVRLEPSGRQYQLPRGIICAKSEYFNSAFKKHYSEGQNGVIALDDVTPWVFEAFMAWLYTGQIFWDPGNQLDAGFDAPTEQDSHHENDKQKAITWHWRNLIQLFIFADKYDTKAFRHDIMVIFQIKTLMKKPREYEFLPTDEEAAHAFNNLPSSSPLYRFLLDGYVHSRHPRRLDKSSELHVLPPDALALLVTKLMQENCRLICKACNAKQPCDSPTHADERGLSKPYFNTPCHYHEHKDENERLECVTRFQKLREEHVFAKS